MFVNQQLPKVLKALWAMRWKNAFPKNAFIRKR